MDVWTALGVKKPSVSIAFRKLASGNLIRVHENHEVDLTENGYASVQNQRFLCNIQTVPVQHRGPGGSGGA